MAPKLTLQLTPLLDLLLIVIFAQYMDIQQASRRDQTANAVRIRAAQEELQAANRSLESLREQRETSTEKLEQTQQTLQQLLRQSAEAERTAKTQVSELTRALSLAREQRDLVGELVVELFRVPEEVLTEALADPEAGAAIPAADRVEKLRQRFREMSQFRADDMVKHLLSYEELRKRCDVWDLYITQQGVFVLSVGEHSTRFRADDGEEFQNKLFEAYKGLPQPKSLVLILLSYGDAKAKAREAALAGLPPASERMRADSNGRTRFEYTALGYRPERPASPVR